MRQMFANDVAQQKLAKSILSTQGGFWFSLIKHEQQQLQFTIVKRQFSAAAAEEHC